MKRKALHIGREKLNTFGTVLRIIQDPAHQLGDLCIAVSSFMKISTHAYVLSIRMYMKQAHRLKYKLCGDFHMQCSSPTLQSPSLSIANPVQISIISENCSKPPPSSSEKSCHVKSDQPYLLYNGVDIIRVSTSMKTLRRRTGSICFLCLTL